MKLDFFFFSFFFFVLTQNLFWIIIPHHIFYLSTYILPILLQQFCENPSEKIWHHWWLIKYSKEPYTTSASIITLNLEVTQNFNWIIISHYVHYLGIFSDQF